MERKTKGQYGNLLENLSIVILVFYPLRHINWGLDLWDTGYNYANFQYIGMEHMDPMWLFSTFLANVTGSLLTRLPNADSLMGMNLYTGLFVSVLALIGYFFCTRKLKMPRWIAFVGEMAAISLCWCPTALLYNYLTYVLFLVSTIFLYLGLTKEKKGYLVCAGVLLGSNVVVRFSNLPEMGMIVAVWAYDIIVWLEDRKAAGRETTSGKPDRTGTGVNQFSEKRDWTGTGMNQVSGKPDRTGTGMNQVSGKLRQTAAGVNQAPGKRSGMSAGRWSTSEKSAKQETFWRKTTRHTLWCLAGYLAGFAFWLSYIHICYGIDEYVRGIGRLFAMTENAADYRPTAMIMGILGSYIENMYWFIRLAVITAGGMVLFMAASWLEEALNRKSGANGDFASESCKAARVVHIGVRAAWILVCAAMIVWLFFRNFFSFLFYSYDPIWHPGPVFLMLTMLIALIRIFQKSSPKEEKLISGMVILILLLTPIGSNNGVLPSLNNLFLAAPYMLWESWRFVRSAKDKRLRGMRFAGFPVKGILTALLALCLFLFGVFGAQFAFAEATGIQEASAYVYNNPVLKNVKMSPQRAQWMQELSGYVNEEGLQGKAVILYGKIPALSYYLQMPAAFNPWSDLDSYQSWVMEEELEELKGLIALKGAEKPVIILEDTYARFAEQVFGGQTIPVLSEENRQTLGKNPMWRVLLEYMDLFDCEEHFRKAKQQTLEADSKWMLLLDFMDTLDYEQTFRNEKFSVYR